MLPVRRDLYLHCNIPSLALMEIKSPVWNVNTGCHYEDRVSFLLLCILLRCHFTRVPLRASRRLLLPLADSDSFYLFSSFSPSLFRPFFMNISHYCECVCDRLCIMGFNWSLWGGFRVFWEFKNSKVWTRRSDSRSPWTQCTYLAMYYIFASLCSARTVK